MSRKAYPYQFGSFILPQTLSLGAIGPTGISVFVFLIVIANGVFWNRHQVYTM
jgi:hypothetical protein